MGANARRGLGERFTLAVFERLERAAHLVGGELELGYLRRANVIERSRMLEERGIAARANVGDDPSHRRIDRGILRDLERRQERELAVERRRVRVEPAQREHRVVHRAPPRREATACAIASSNGCTTSRFNLSAAGLTMRRELIGRISSTATRSFALSVF